MELPYNITSLQANIQPKEDPKLRTLKEFIASIPPHKTYRPILVKLYEQIQSMKLRDDDFLRRQANEMKKALTAMEEKYDEVTEKWVGEVAGNVSERFIIKNRPKNYPQHECPYSKSYSTMADPFYELSKTEITAVNYVLTTYFRTELKRYQKTMEATRKNSTGVLSRLSSSAYDEHLWKKEQDEAAFLGILKTLKKHVEEESERAITAAEIIRLKHRVKELEKALGIAEGVGPPTGISQTVTHYIVPKGPLGTIQETLDAVVKKQKIPEIE